MPAGSPTPAADITAAMRPARFGTSNFRISRLSWAETARCETRRRAAISLLVWPRATSPTTSACFAVRPTPDSVIRSETYIYHASRPGFSIFSGTRRTKAWGRRTYEVTAHPLPLHRTRAPAQREASLGHDDHPRAFVGVLPVRRARNGSPLVDRRPERACAAR